jgi:hypothetical protein
VLAALALLAGCGQATPSAGDTPALSSPVAEASPCAPTVPNGSTPPGERPSRAYHGNGRLWTVLWPHGVVVIGPDGVRPDGSLAMKFPFWRGSGVRGPLVVTGRSVERPELTMTGEVPQGYGDTGFQASALVFPEPGCWSVTASVGDAGLSFVTEVRQSP